MICPLCNKSTSSLALDTHIKVFHGKFVRNLKCKHAGCFRVFSDLRSFKKHIKTSSHDGEESDRTEVQTLTVENETIVDELAAENVALESDNGINNSISLSETIRNSADQFVCKQYANPSVPRSVIQSIIEDTTVFMNDCIQSSFKTDIVQILNDCNASKEQLDKVNDMFELVKSPLVHLASEYLRLKYFKQLGFLVQPELCDVDGGEVVSIPLKEVLKKFLELPDVFDTILSFIESCQSNDSNFKNFMQCPVWQAKRATYEESDIVIPLNLFIDGFEINNKLGSRSKSLDGVYASLPCLPPEFQASVDNIFLAQLYLSSLRKKISDEKVFSPLISQLCSLAKNGLVLNTSKGERKVYVVTAMLLGDNKGLHSVSGFVEGFTANYFCRFCKSHRDNTYNQCVQDDSLLRSKESYDIDVSTANPTETGVNFNSAFNKLPGFHVTSNYVVDLFHDFAEGICHYTVLHLLKHCIPRYFTLDDLNYRISVFDYGTGEVSNKIPLISHNFATKRKLKMSGSEILTFVRFLGLLIGDRIPEHDPYWQLHLKLCQLLDICLAKSLSQKKAVTIKVLVEEFNSMYVSVTGDLLKPKMHFLLHYAMVLEKNGSFDIMSTKRYESKHRSLTIPGHSTMSRRNISFTCAMRHQLAQSFRFFTQKPLLSLVEIGPSELVLLSDFENVSSFSKHFPDFMLSNDVVVCVDWVRVKGTLYKPGMVLITNVNDSGPVFSEISEIIVQDEVVIFMYRYFLNCGFNQHYHAYAVQYSDKWSCISHDNIYDPFPVYFHHDICGDKYIVLKYGF